MFRQTLTKTSTLRASSRAFATTSRAMSAGDTGAPPKTGGQGYVLFYFIFAGKPEEGHQKKNANVGVL